MMDGDSDEEEQEDLMGGMSDLERLKNAFQKRKFLLLKFHYFIIIFHNNAN